ncbi:ATP-binding protein [Streptomyces sp. BI20]|uniref:ATP-binding protein n=1 Tax=Streptomyces sp. BI20 TaxID=3403460 RepID=UPI003C754840
MRTPHPFPEPDPTRSPLRTKIAALAATTACLVAAIVGTLVHVWTVEDMHGRAEARALSMLHSAMDMHRRTGQLMDGAALDPADLPARLRAPRDAERHLALDERIQGNLGPSFWAAQRTDGPGSPVLAVQTNMSGDFHDLRQLDISMVGASLVGVGAATLVSVGGARLLGHRLGRVSATARRISAGDLQARIGPVRGRDEVSEIAATVDGMADSLARRLQDERRFTADVAHELRTPVGGLLAATDLLPEGEIEDLLRGRVRDLRDLVEDLLEVSRLDAGAERAARGRVPLAVVVADAVTRTGLDAEVIDGAGGGFVETDPRRLERIVANLVINAHRHGSAPVRVTVGPRSVEVRDQGPGFPAELLAHGPRRFHTGAADRGSGHGLGLTIALGQAALLDAELRFANAPGGGAVATLLLPPDTGPEWPPPTRLQNRYEAAPRAIPTGQGPDTRTGQDRPHQAGSNVPDRDVTRGHRHRRSSARRDRPPDDLPSPATGRREPPEPAATRGTGRGRAQDGERAVTMDSDKTTRIPTTDRRAWPRPGRLALGAAGLVLLGGFGFTVLSGGDNPVGYVAGKVIPQPKQETPYDPETYDGHGRVPRPDNAVRQAAYDKTTTEYEKEVRPAYTFHGEQVVNPDQTRFSWCGERFKTAYEKIGCAAALEDQDRSWQGDAIYTDDVRKLRKA